MTRNIALAAGFFFLICSPAFAQFYPTQFRPAVDWQQLSTPHFKVVFPAGEDSAAYQTARLLEEHYAGTQQLVGGSLKNFPVILTNYNDRSNGFVTSLHFRSEIDIPPHKGKLLNPETGSWLQSVVPHELVHAMQFNHIGGFGLGQLVNIFSPDLARSMHGASPSGIREGLATYYESHSVTEGGGRGNYPYFSNQYKSIFESSLRWSMGQTVQSTDYSRPFNRIYLGGYTFTEWLQQTYGAETSRDAVEFNIRWPFLGYGIALKHATGKWPAQLYDAFEKEKQKQFSNEVKKQEVPPLEMPFKGGEVRRPKWRSDSTLVFHGSFYNERPGFYRYTLSNHSIERLITTRSVADYNYALSIDGRYLYYSYYDADPINTNAFKARLIKADLIDGNDEKILPRHRLYSPTLSADSSLIALQTHRTGVKVVNQGLTNRSVKTIYADSSRQVSGVATHPTNADSLAIVMNHKGIQALWLTAKKSIETDLNSAPNISFEDGSIFDPVWHPGGDRLLFSADFSGTLQVYEYDLQADEMSQITNARYNAFEASYSPDGNRIAFITQQANEQVPAVLSRDEFDGGIVAGGDYTAGNTADDTGAGAVPSGWVRSSYTTGLGWLKPRTVLPIIEEVPGGIDQNEFQFGAGLHSSDLLQQQAYSLNLTTAEGRLWYDATYQNKQFFPGLKLRAFSDPVFRTFGFQTETGERFAQTFLRQERSLALSMPVQLRFSQNVHFTSLFIEPEIRFSQLRYFDRNGENPSDFFGTSIGNLFSQFNYRLQQNIRDVQPNSGLVLYSEIEHFFSSRDVTLNTRRGSVPLSTQPTALRGGIIGYVSPLRRYNQSLRIGLEGITQTDRFFDNQFLVSDGFSEAVFPFTNNLFGLNTRYTIPLFYPDNGGLLLPLYLSSIYLSAFSNTVIDPGRDSLANASRTVIGGGLRLQFRISNLSLDIGIGIGYEPSRNNTNVFIGNF